MVSMSRCQCFITVAAIATIAAAETVPTMSTIGGFGHDVVATSDITTAASDAAAATAVRRDRMTV